MRIKIPESTVTQEEEKYFRMLEDSKDFEYIVFAVRKLCHIPKDGFPYQNHSVLKLISKENKLLITQTAQDLTTKLNLNNIYWLSTFVNIIIFNTVTSPTKDKYPPLAIEAIGNLVRINIREVTSVKQITDFIKSNSRYLNKKLSNLPKAPKAKLENLELRKTMSKLESEGKTSLEIAREIEDNYDNPPFQPDYEIVNEQLARYRVYVYKLTKRLKELKIVNKSEL